MRNCCSTSMNQKVDLYYHLPQLKCVCFLSFSKFSGRASFQNLRNVKSSSFFYRSTPFVLSRENSFQMNTLTNKGHDHRFFSLKVAWVVYLWQLFMLRIPNLKVCYIPLFCFLHFSVSTLYKAAKRKGQKGRERVLNMLFYFFFPKKIDFVALRRHSC